MHQEITTLLVTAAASFCGLTWYQVKKPVHLGESNDHLDGWVRVGWLEKLVPGWRAVGFTSAGSTPRAVGFLGWVTKNRLLQYPSSAITHHYLIVSYIDECCYTVELGIAYNQLIDNGFIPWWC